MLQGASCVKQPLFCLASLKLSFLALLPTPHTFSRRAGTELPATGVCVLSVHPHTSANGRTHRLHAPK